MASTPQWFDRVMASSTTTGTGTYTLGSAITGYQAWSVVGDDNSAYYCAQDVDGNGTPIGDWEVGLGTYTTSGTTLSRDTVMASSNAGAAVNWAAGTRRVFLVSPAGVQTYGGLVPRIPVTLDADLSMSVGALYVLDISGYTADRTYTLPATASAGDRCGILISTGDDAFELLITAASGDTLNTVAGGTEWSRLFIAMEVVIFRCTVASTTWVVETDGRIPMSGKLRVSTQGDGETASTVTLPTDVGGAWTMVTDNGSLTVTATGRIVMRRACQASIVNNLQAKDNVIAGGAWASVILVSGTERARAWITPGLTVASAPAVTVLVILCVVDDYVQGAFVSQAGGLGIRANSGCHFSVNEILNKYGAT